MKTAQLKVIGKTPVHGRKPGDVFTIETDDDGVPLDLLWRKRLRDEKQFKVGLVEIVSSAAPVIPASPETTQPKGAK